MLAVVVFLSVSAVVWFLFRSGPRPDPAAIQELLDRGASIVDVRTPGEFAGGHVEGARNIPVDQIGLRLADVGDKDKPVIVYCRSGARSRRATAILRQAGFDAVDVGTARAFPPRT